MKARFAFCFVAILFFCLVAMSCAVAPRSPSSTEKNSGISVFRDALVAWHACSIAAAEREFDPENSKCWSTLKANSTALLGIYYPDWNGFSQGGQTTPIGDSRQRLLSAISKYEFSKIRTKFRIVIHSAEVVRLIALSDSNQKHVVVVLPDCTLQMEQTISDCAQSHLKKAEVLLSGYRVSQSGQFFQSVEFLETKDSLPAKRVFRKILLESFENDNQIVIEPSAGRSEFDYNHCRLKREHAKRRYNEVIERFSVLAKEWESKVRSVRSDLEHALQLLGCDSNTTSGSCEMTLSTGIVVSVFLNREPRGHGGSLKLIFTNQYDEEERYRFLQTYSLELNKPAVVADEGLGTFFYDHKFEDARVWLKQKISSESELIKALAGKDCLE